LKDLFAYEEKLLLEEHQHFINQQRDIELEILRQKAAAVESAKDAERKELAHKKKIQQFKYIYFQFH
jgi:hypothetical protein